MSPIQFSLKDGRSVKIRPAQASDLPAIDAMHDRLSKQSLYYRYFSARKPSLAALRQQLELSQRGGAALVAVLESQPDEIIGMAYYLFSREAGCLAEPALLVEDRFQGQGLGRALFSRLIQAALAQALSGFQLFILPENRGMLQLLKRIGAQAEQRYRDGLFQVRLSFQ